MSNLSLFPEYEKTLKEKIVEAQALPLERKITIAISLFQVNEEIALSLSPEGYYLAFSGGKDSIVIKELAKMAGVRFKSYYNQTTIDPPELIYYIREHHPEVTWNRAEKPLPFKMEDKSNGPPTRLARWCCEIYKECGGFGSFKVIGVRAAESPRRALAWQHVTPHKKKKGGVNLCPILYWTDKDVWDFIKQRNLPYCKLYDEGFKRLGCVGCPLADKQRVKEFKRWPGFERLWKLGFQKYWNRWKGVPRLDGKPRWIERFTKWEELWDWWMTGKKYVKPEEVPEECQTSLLFTGEPEEIEE